MECNRACFQDVELLGHDLRNSCWELEIELLLRTWNAFDNWMRISAGNIISFSIRCILKELESLGKELYGAKLIAQRFQVRKCSHFKNPVSGSACLLSMIEEGNPHHYFIGTQVIVFPVSFILVHESPRIEIWPAANMSSARKVNIWGKFCQNLDLSHAAAAVQDNTWNCSQPAFLKKWNVLSSEELKLFHPY